MVYVIAAVLIVVGFMLVRKRVMGLRREDLLASVLTDYDWDIVLDQVPLVSKLPIDLHAPLQGKINLFLDQVEFHGCNGLEVTDDMRLSIAAQACLMILGRDDLWYETLQTVLIYPSAFKSRTQEYDGYLVRERETVRTGESWARGPVILSWRHSEMGALDAEDGHNVVIHEFAHQLDNLTGSTNALPILSEDQSIRDWDRVFGAGYKRLRRQVEKGRKTLIAPYGATATVEFFAVLVELFFERPQELRKEEPEIYRELAAFFNLDMAGWH